MFDDQDKPDLPPGSPVFRTFEGPWLTMQLSLSCGIGLFSFVVFSFCRRRWPLLFSPRTKLKDFSPHEAHLGNSSSAWIIPTIRISELSVLQIVGLDAAVLLNFLKTSFYLFLSCALLAGLILMPINYYVGKSLVDGDDWIPNGLDGGKPSPPPPDWYDLITEANAFLVVQFIFTWAFSLLTMRFLLVNYRRFVRARQLFSLELVHSIAARTVLVSFLPPHLRGERALATYYENMGFAVESVSVCRERTAALLKLEHSWTQYVGNPCAVEAYDPSRTGPLIDIPPSNDSRLAPPPRLVVPHRERPTLRPKWWSPKKVDALEYLETEFKTLDEAFRKKRRSGKFRAAHCAFVTFETMSAAQAVAQIAAASVPSQSTATLAPEPRDIVWANMTLSPSGQRTRDIAVTLFIGGLLLFWAIPISALSSLLSYEQIQKVMPWLGNIIDRSPVIQALVQNSLPSVALIALNGLLPIIFEGLSYLQGFRARSWIEYSLLKKYFLFLLINVVFEFLVASTYWQLFRDLADSPAKVPEKLATALQKGNTRRFFLSYVILQAFGIMPLQLLNLGVIIPRFFYRAFVTRTPRDFAELNAPPMVNYGAVYPQAILIFVITILYSVIQPLILFVGAAYFGISYVVYKYKVLFVFYKPYESQGEAWPITFVRMMWGVVIFQVFMAGIFLLKKSFYLASLMTPLILFTVYWTWSTDALFGPLSAFVGLSSVCEVQRGEEADEVRGLRHGHPVSWSQSNLNRRRYAQNDETLYVAPEDDRTDYSQPPMANWYNGVLNTGKRRYGHPAMTGVLPQPWLPIKKGQSLANNAPVTPGRKVGWRERLAGRGAPPGAANGSEGGAGEDAVVLTLRRRRSGVRPDIRKTSLGPERRQSAPLPSTGTPGQNPGAAGDGVPSGGIGQSSESLGALNPWDTASTRRGRRLSFDAATGIINLPDGDDDEELERGHAGIGGTPVVVPPDREQTDSDSDSEYGSASSMSGETHAALSTADEAGPSSGTSGALGGGTSRHRTYYHHPEKRKSMQLS
ncbi:DUF221-domain-containing protein [Auriculariales sp. MPI-PUGE-AT-0066]|nr:DUF221-domain-containing protein [Auriculariales sp. MPI-PUGE-AT-0066]